MEFLGKILREAWMQDSKDIEHDLYFLAWLMNRREIDGRETKGESGRASNFFMSQSR